MIAEIGLFLLLIGLLFSILLVVLPSLGLLYNKREWLAAASLYVRGQFCCVLLSYACLTFSFLTNDFTVMYVMANSSASLPWFYKLCAVWGGHEGSMLLWVTILSLWMLAVSYCSTQLDQEMRTRILVVLGLLSVGFLLFLITTSNPFYRQFGLQQSEGRDLNPLLQDPGFLLHPPMLYMGYVGFSVAFAFAIGALWAGRMEASWTKWTRPWTLLAWCCLTVGITLGSWWAYRELGWGGWWFWDPVENASFMPWLVGTALIHSLIVSEQRQQFKAWTLLLAITSFSLSLIGTFLVRSGVLTSVHAFAVDPQRGLYILCFLILVIGGALLLFAMRGQMLQSAIRVSLLSRESALLLNNLFLTIAMLTVLLGTLYPLLIDGLGLGKLSVGSPYFNTVFIPLMIPVLLFMGLAIHIRWQEDRWRTLVEKLKTFFFLSGSLSFLVLILFAQVIKIQAFLGLMLAFWIILSTLKGIYLRGIRRGAMNMGNAFWGMALAHCGVAITTIGIAISSNYGLQEDSKLKPGESVYLGGYLIRFVETFPLLGPNYHGTRTCFAIYQKGKTKFIYPEKRIYEVGQMALSESAIDVTPFRDIYIALGEPLGDNEWSVRLYYKPLIRWIWGGGFLIFLGGVTALLDRRHFKHRPITNITAVGS